MLDKIIKRSFYRQKHLDAPLLKERLQYIKYWTGRSKSHSTLLSVADYTLRIVQFLNLTEPRRITYSEIEKAGDAWGRYKYNHPQKRAPFSNAGKERFIWYSIDWLRMLNWLEPLPEEKIPLFNKIFERRKALQRHTSAPLLEERLLYLQYWADNGGVDGGLRNIAQYLLVIMEYLKFERVKKISYDEIKEAAKRWAKDKKVYRRKSDYSKFANSRFIRHAIGWFNMLGCLKRLPKEHIPFENKLNQYICYLREEKGLSENTIKSKQAILKNFLLTIKTKNTTLSKLTPQTIDEILINKHDTDGYSRRTIQTYASIVRSFLRYAAEKNFCKKNLPDSIKAPRVYRYELLPSSPSWDDIRKILANNQSNRPADIRDHAILMLLSIYGMRCSEVTHLRLDDIDWQKELIYLQRAKHSKPQTFPLSKVVGEAILRYIKYVRPNVCSLRTIFICMRAPYRPLKSAAIYRIVSKNLKPLNINIKHYGPHALRHACATHLINEGVSLKEISDHLGHQRLETTRIYAKVDLANLRKVTQFSLGGLL